MAKAKVGDRIKFYSNKGAMYGTIQRNTTDVPELSKLMCIRINGNPFDSFVDPRHVKLIRKEVKDMGEAAELSRQARNLSIKGWQDMNVNELKKAIAKAEAKEQGEENMDDDDDLFSDFDEPESDEEETEEEPVKKSTKKKTTAKKKASAKKATTKPKTAAKPKSTQKKASPKKSQAQTSVKRKTAKSSGAKSKAQKPAKAQTKAKTRGRPVKATTTSKKAKPGPKPRSKAKKGENPFREGSQLALVADQLIKGGKLEVIATRLLKKLDLRPRNAESKKKMKKDPVAVMMQRISLVSGLMEKEGWTIEKDGWGRQAKIKAVP